VKKKSGISQTKTKKEEEAIVTKRQIDSDTNLGRALGGQGKIKGKKGELTKTTLYKQVIPLRQKRI